MNEPKFIEKCPICDGEQKIAMEGEDDLLPCIACHATGWITNKPYYDTLLKFRTGCGR